MTTLIVTRELSYPSGNAYHVRTEAVRSTELNADCYRVLYSINGSYYHANGEPRLHEYHANYALYAHHMFAGDLAQATQITLYAIENALDTREYRILHAGSDTPLKRVNRIMDWIRANRKLVHSAFASTVLVDVPTVKIEVWHDNFATVSDAIGQWVDGVAIDWTIRDYTPQSLFLGTFDKTGKIPVLDVEDAA